MRIRIAHETVYRYEEPAAGIIQILRLTPRNHEGQYVIDWRIDLSAECRLDCHEDAFGNVTHTFAVDGPVADLAVHVEGEVETQDTNGIVRGSIERFPPSLFLRDTPLTAADAAIEAFAHDARREARETAEGTVLNQLHVMLDRLHEDIAFDARELSGAPGTAAEAFARRRATCQDFAHMFISAARSLAIPARYAGGYLHRTEGAAEEEVEHAWAEAFVPELGWIGFDAANGLCPTDAYVRVAIGLDYLGAAPVRGNRYGGGNEVRAVSVRIGQAGYQRQE